MTEDAGREGDVFDPMDCAFCCAGGGRRMSNGASSTCPLHGGPMPPTDEDEIRRDERRKVAEEIARAIEVAEGYRCPDCGGKPAAFVDFGHGQKQRSCGGGHRWSVALSHMPAAQVARQHAQPASAVSHR
ncbi:hypothetical protein [Micromonospora sp. NPDC050695]|uniref:hypothetical protein n=1 Tax=Micromonospora sp. NPDC050695 TaxID=3154938 RepID=UPI0033DD41BF